MKRLLGIVVALMIAQPAFAFHCPADMAAIDAALAAGPQITAEQLATVTALRAEGEVQHAAGNHDKSVELLQQAMAILGIA